MKKKILSLILALLMASSSAALAAADEAVTLTAASENPVHAASAEFLNAQNIMKGKNTDGDLDLALNDNVKRYEMALFVSRISMGGEWLNDEAWKNVDVPALYTDLEGSGAVNVMGALHYATTKGIIEGYGNGEFGPEKTVTYQDALTMVVRTLGYTGLEWPWEYIEKAIDLGLTKNIGEGKSYTSDMNRGEVAQLIYNALNTVKKDGATLAAEVFNMKETTVIITANDRIVFEKGATVAPENKIAFKLYDLATGAIGDKTYYASAAEFGFVEVTEEGKEVVKKNAMNQAVGHLFKVLLNTDDNGDVTADAEGIYVKSLLEASDYSTPVANRAYEILKDEKGNVIPSAIAAELDKLTLSTKYTRTGDEVVIYTATSNALVSSTTSNGVIIDWVSGNILQECAKDDPDMTITAENGKFYKVAWHYSTTLNRYYKLVTTAKDGKLGYVWLEDAELAEIVDSLKNTTTTVQAATIVKKEQINGKAAYADLTLESFSDGKALQGTYQEYKLGYLKNEKKKCAVCEDGTAAGFEIYDVLEEMELLESGEFGYGSGTKFSKEPAIKENKPHTKKAGCTNNSVWLSGEAIPSKDCYVIYSFNDVTKELKIVETVETVKGVLRGYSTKNELVLLATANGNEKLSLGYDNLLGSSFIINDAEKTAEEKAAKQAQIEKYLDGLDGLLNEYVECAVINGKVVSMRTVEKSTVTEKYLIMQGYVGNTVNGEIVVEAYAASTGELAQYIVTNFDNASARKYADVADNADLAKAEFAAGNLYYVSVMEDNKIEIEKFGGYDANGNYDIETNKVATKNTKITFTDDGYKMVGGQEEANEGTYIIISPVKVEGRSPIYVYGKDKKREAEVYDTSWEISGKVLKSVNDATVNVFVPDMVDGEQTLKMNGFAYDAYKHGMYLYAGGNVYDQVNGKEYYDAMYGEATVLVPTVSYLDLDLINLYTGKVERKTVTNLTKKDLEAGKIYVTIQNDKDIQSVQCTWDADTFVEDMANVFYQDRYVGVARNDRETSADYLFGTVTGATGAATIKDIKAALKADGYYANESLAKVTAEKLVQKLVTVDEKGLLTLTDLTTWFENNKGAEVEYTYVYNTANDTTVVYATVTKEAPEAGETTAPEVDPEVEGTETSVATVEAFADAKAAAEANAPENTEIAAWIIGGKRVEAAEAEAYLANALKVAGEAITIKPVYAPVTEPKETEPKETEPKETEPKETEPKETEPKETEPKETEPKETEPKETEPKETEPKETEPKETEPKETEPKETEPKETEPKETEPKETEPKETEPKETEPKETVAPFVAPEGTVLNPGKVITSSANDVTGAFDGNVSTGVTLGGAGNGFWMGIELEQTGILAVARLAAFDNNGDGTTDRVHTIFRSVVEGSNDGETWTKIMDFGEDYADFEDYAYNHGLGENYWAMYSEDTTDYKYFRVWNGDDNDTWGEVEFYVTPVEQPEFALTSIEVSLDMTSENKADSYAFAEFEYDTALLVFKGVNYDEDTCDAMAASFLGAEGIDADDTTINSIVIGLMKAQALSGKICDVVFEVAEGADVDAAIAAANSVKFNRIVVKNTKEEVTGCVLTATAVPVYSPVDAD